MADDKASRFSRAMRVSSATGEKNHIQGAFRRASIAGSKLPRLKPAQVRAQRIAAAINQTRRAQAINAKNLRFKMRLSRVKAAARKGIKGTRRSSTGKSSDNR